MRLTVFNGSPRGTKSNTDILINSFLDGFMRSDGNTYELAYLKRIKESNNFIKLFQATEQVLLAFPLYLDGPPAIVKTFIELLEPLCGRADNPGVGFIVQSGFPEANHSRWLERYLKKLASRLNCEYKGTVIKGGVEGIQALPALASRKLLRSFYKLGKTFGETGEFDQQIVRKLAQPERLTKFQFWRFNLLGKFYWNTMLRKNKAFGKRFDKPYS
ncbi:NAD(P)H-dependent oxidoreductase [Candidatus Parcubacteria bacterium]|nr:NAD(P)H-dependent oxidoreductase [Candidatus Parcubacteria bacterium]